MVSNYVCSLAVAVVSLFVAVVVLSSVTCDGTDCFALHSFGIMRTSRQSDLLTSEEPPQTQRIEDVSGAPKLKPVEELKDKPLVEEAIDSGLDTNEQEGDSGRDHEEHRHPEVETIVQDSKVAQDSEGLSEGVRNETVVASAIEDKSVEVQEVPELEEDHQGPELESDPVIFGMGFYPDGRFHPDTGFNLDAPAEPPLLPSRKVLLNVVDFGAIGDGTTLNTAAFEAAVAAASDSGGGALLRVPAGVWLTGCFNLTSHLTLFLDSGAVLLASQDPLLWPVLPPLPSYGQGRDMEGPRYGSFLHGEHLTDVVITGNNGTINGQGDPWWAAFKARQLAHTRGCLIELQWSSHVVISNLTLLDSPFWNVHLYDSHDVTVHGLTILAPKHSKNTDGVDPDSCTDVLIENCYISSGDDAIAIKSGMDAAGVAYGKPTRNVVVRNLVVGRTHGLSIGSEMSGGVANVLFHNITLLGPGSSGLRIKSARGRGGYVTNITYQNIVLENQKYAISVYSNYRQDAATTPAASLPRLEGFLFQNVTGRRIVYAGRLVGLADFPLRGIKLDEVYLEAQKRYKCDFVYVEARNAEPPPCQRGWDSQNKRGLLESWFWTQRKLVAILGFPNEWTSAA